MKVYEDFKYCIMFEDVTEILKFKHLVNGCTNNEDDDCDLVIQLMKQWCTDTIGPELEKWGYEFSEPNCIDVFKFAKDSYRALFTLRWS
jgi:hypothetical protein